MRRLLSSLLILFALASPVFVASSSAGAVDIFGPCSGNGATTTACKSVRDQQSNGNDNPVIDIIRAAIQVLAFIIGLAAIVSLVVSSFRLITSRGDSNAAASARSGIVTALIGVAVAVVAEALVLYVLGG